MDDLNQPTTSLDTGGEDGVVVPIKKKKFHAPPKQLLVGGFMSLLLVGGMLLSLQAVQMNQDNRRQASDNYGSCGNTLNGGFACVSAIQCAQCQNGVFVSVASNYCALGSICNIFPSPTPTRIPVSPSPTITPAPTRSGVCVLGTYRCYAYIIQVCVGSVGQGQWQDVQACNYPTVCSIVNGKGLCAPGPTYTLYPTPTPYPTSRPVCSPLGGYRCSGNTLEQCTTSGWTTWVHCLSNETCSTAGGPKCIAPTPTPAPVSCKTLGSLCSDPSQCCSGLTCYYNGQYSVCGSGSSP